VLGAIVTWDAIALLVAGLVIFWGRWTGRL